MCVIFDCFLEWKDKNGSNVKYTIARKARRSVGVDFRPVAGTGFSCFFFEVYLSRHKIRTRLNLNETHFFVA